MKYRNHTKILAFLALCNVLHIIGLYALNAPPMTQPLNQATTNTAMSPDNTNVDLNSIGSTNQVYTSASMMPTDQSSASQSSMMQTNDLGNHQQVEAAPSEGGVNPSINQPVQTMAPIQMTEIPVQPTPQTPSMIMQAPSSQQQPFQSLPPQWRKGSSRKLELSNTIPQSSSSPSQSTIQQVDPNNRQARLERYRALKAKELGIQKVPSGMDQKRGQQNQKNVVSKSSLKTVVKQARR